MAIETFYNAETMLSHRNKLDNNFAQTELLINKTNSVTSASSATKYVTENAVYDYVQKQYYQPTVPTTRDGDTIILSSSNGKSKYKVNDGGIVKEVVFDRSCGNYLTASQFAALNSVLLAGEMVTESDTKKTKIGDGTTTYNSLPYSGVGNFGGNADAGWVKMPNGFITHWGKANTTTTSDGVLDKTISLPFSFTTQMIYANGVLDTESADWNNNQLVVHVRQTSLNQIRFCVSGGLAVSSSAYKLRYIITGI